MDTVSKKFNFKAVKRLIAFVMCLICVGMIISNCLSGVISAQEHGLTMVSLRDALSYDVASPIWESDSFRSSYNGYLNYLYTLIGEYGNGTKKDYELARQNTEKYNEAVWKRVKENLTKHLQSTSICYDYLVAEYDGIVTSLGYVAPTDLASVKDYYYDEDVLRDDSFNYFELEDGDYSEWPQITVYNEMLQAAKELGADGIVKIDYNCLITTDYYDDIADEDIIKKYKSGYYAFRINEGTLEKKLYERNILRSYFDYEQFSTNYERINESIKQFYDTGRYFIMDSMGNTYTNMKGLSANSTTEQVAEAFGKLGFYCYQSSGGYMCLPDGKIYSVMSISDMAADDVEIYISTTSEDFIVYSATTHNYPSMPSAEVVQTTIPESITAPVSPTQSTTMMSVSSVAATTGLPPYTDGTEFDNKPFIASGDVFCFVGVDMTAENYSELNRFAAAQKEIGIAKEIVSRTVTVCGICFLVFLAALISLIVLSGKRSGDKKGIYLFRTDRIFAEIRLALSGGLCALAGIVAYELVENVDSTSSAGKGILSVGYVIIGVVIAAIIIDVLLFFVRHLKNKSLLRSFFVIRALSKAAKLLSRLYKSTAERIRRFRERILYVKDLKKTVFIRAAIIVVINGAVMLCSIIMLYNSTELGLISIALLGMFDLFVIYRGLVFVGGVDRLFKVVGEMRKGNLEEKINRGALPDYLMLPAENLQGLGEGLRVAVEEAVRQEQTKTELITNVSHDLKTPLTSIINYVDLLKKCDITDETAVSYLNVLSEKSDRLKNLISDLVEASKASTGAINVSFVDVSLRELLSQILGEYEDDFEKRKLALVVASPEKDITVKADSKLLYRVMENLMVNVRKYALENSRVYIDIREEDGEGIIEIKNISAAPLNISAQELKSRFVRGDQSRSTEGNGLGLSIAENLCTIQQGRLELEINGDLFVARVRMKSVG